MLQLKHLKKYFATQKAVDDISFEIEQGTIFGLLGPNGAGKTTLIRMITGIFHPDEGEIILDGKKFNGLEDAQFIGYMPEERGLYKKMKIGEQAVYLAQLKGLSKKDALEKCKYWFQRLNMETWWDKKVEDLSKGMGQKFQFVITVLHDPKLIILDEPFSGLDPVNANLIKDEIFALAKQGKTVIFSTHRMEQVEEICDKIVLVSAGKNILEGKVGMIRQQFKEGKYKIALNEDAQLQEGMTYDILPEIESDAFIIKLREGVSSNAVLKEIMQQGAEIKGFNEILPSLNDIFIKLVDQTPTARQFNQL